MILFQENFVEDNECDKLINLFIKNKFYTEFYPINSTNILKGSKIKDDILEKIKEKVVSNCSSLTNSKIYLDNYELVEWPTGSYHPPHYDLPTDIFSSVIYLNDNFDGGETYFSESKIIKPQKRCCLTFSNSKYRHSVNKINTGTRYTFSFWFSRISQ
jgi:hypothetical protein